MRRGCVDEGTVVAFLDGELAPDARSLVERHLDLCKACGELMTWAAADQTSHGRAREARPFIGQLAPGSSIDRYQILGAVGRGGMGEVYAAYHPDLDRRIALKVVRDSGDSAPERRARLLREARAIARLSHPNVVTVHDAGTFEDHVYIAMEFVEGDTIDAWLRAERRSWREIVDVFVAAGRGLAAAHAGGVIHRDFKPQNVMIGRDGAVRVMDFGLARLEDEPNTYEPGLEVRGPDPQSVLTTAGTAVGTPAYMAPEQFRRETLDGRADQFSFCVALHEALYGRRPIRVHLQDEATRPAGARDGGGSTQAANVPSWLRAIVVRGLAEARARRFPSMDVLIRALVKGRTRPRRRTVGISLGLALALLGWGGWRAARGSRVSCEVPTARLAAVWSGHDDTRRQAIHRAFAATARPTAETSWHRVATLLDSYIGAWSAMYVDACEATHLRGEQSSEVLDLRMECLSDDLDQVRALTTVLLGSGSSGAAHAVLAMQDLPPLSRCHDPLALRSAIPWPKDERTAERARALAREVNDINALIEFGSYSLAHAKAVALRAPVEALGYKPLLAQLLEVTGSVEYEFDPARAEEVLEEAVFTAQACRDDLTVAKAASNLLVLVGDRLGGSQAEADRWGRLAIASLDRLGTEQQRVRAWVLHDRGLVMFRFGDSAGGLDLLERSLAMKEAVLGADHPDVARTLTALTLVVSDSGDQDQALRFANRSVDILSKLDPDNALLGSIYVDRGEVLTKLKRYEEAARNFDEAERIIRLHFEPTNQNFADVFHGFAHLKRVQGDFTAAAVLFEKVLKILEQDQPSGYLVADTRFGLAQCLWEIGRERVRARSLAQRAQDDYSVRNPTRARVVRAWLSTHEGSGKGSVTNTFSNRASRRPMM